MCRCVDGHGEWSTCRLLSTDLKATNRSRGAKAHYIFNHIEGMYTWATAPIIMFVLGWLPLWVAKGQSNALIQAAPFTLEQLMQFAMIGILISAVMSLILLPQRPTQVRRHTWLIMGLQWILLPITFILFGSFPAIDAQTRLMVGKYLGFHVTKGAIITASLLAIRFDSRIAALVALFCWISWSCSRGVPCKAVRSE